MDLAGWEKLNGILEAARLHAEEVILPHVDDWNITKTWPRAASDKAGAAGLMGLYAPEAFGGAIRGYTSL